jgi:hypothetical protein
MADAATLLLSLQMPWQRLPLRHFAVLINRIMKGRNMLAYITTLADEELDAVAAGASVKWTGSATATGLTKADIVGTTTIKAETTKTSEASSVTFSYEVTTA